MHVVYLTFQKPVYPPMINTTLPGAHSKRTLARITPSNVSKLGGLHRDQVCILIPLTSRNQRWRTIEDSFVCRFPLPSLAKTCEPENFSYAIYLGYDVGDAFFDSRPTLWALIQHSKQLMPYASVRIRAFSNQLKKPGPIMNFLSRKAYNDGCDFMYRINDDTELLTSSWTSLFVRALQAFDPPLRGVVGPTCNEGNTRILTHDFVHRGHLDIFETHYPPELTDWWLDDWITSVYGPSNTKKLTEVVVRHHVIVTRYEVQWQSERLLAPLLAQGKQTLIQNLTNSITT